MLYAQRRRGQLDASQAAFFRPIISGPDEQIVADREDLESRFDLFPMPDEWLDYFAFSKQVLAPAMGWPPGEMTYVAIMSVTMGGTNSVDFIQRFLRPLIF